MLRAEAGAGAVGRAPVEGCPEDGDVVLAAATDVLEEGGLEEGVDAGEVRQFPAGERGDPAVHDGVGAREAELETPSDLGLPAGGGELGFPGDGVGRFGTVVVVEKGPGIWVAVGHGAPPRARAVGTAGWTFPSLSRAFVPPWSERRWPRRRLHLSDQAHRRGGGTLGAPRRFPAGRGQCPRPLFPAVFPCVNIVLPAGPVSTFNGPLGNATPSMQSCG